MENSTHKIDAEPGSEQAILRRIINRGDLDALIEYLKAEHPLRVRYKKRSGRKSGLEFAIESGFYSMVKLLLEEAVWGEEELEKALNRALWDRRDDLVGLLLDKGAPIDNVSFYSVFRTMNWELMERLLDAGLDPCAKNAFARALDEIRCKPLLRFYKQHRERFPCLDVQASMALVSAIGDKNVRWASLLIWAGADLDRKVPYRIKDDPNDESLIKVTPREEALSFRDPEFLQVLKIETPASMKVELISEAAEDPKPKDFEALLKDSTVEELNSGENGSCPSLEDLVNQDKRDWVGYDWKKDEELAIQRIDRILQAGAKFYPSDDRIKSLRRSLLTHDGEYVVQVVRLLLYTEEATTIQHVWELCRTDSIRIKIRMVDAPLWDEIIDLASRAGIDAATKYGVRRKKRSGSG